jgi:cyanophycinase
MHHQRFAGHRARSLTVTFVFLASACRAAAPGVAPASSSAARPPVVGPITGSVMVVGGGAQGPEVYAKFIELAGGPDAIIIDVPTAGGDSIDVATAGRAWKNAGAKNVVIVHTTDRKVADADSFVAKISKAGGVWFDGGRHYRLVDSYLGTKTQKAFEQVLARGGVIGGSSAGASILGDYLVRGAPSNDNRIFNHPKYLKGFAYLRGVAIDQHVVARERLPDMFDSLTSHRSDLLGISEDEGTVWVVRGDEATIIGRNKAFVYNGKDATDAGKPFLTLRPGDKYNLAARRVVSRAIASSALTPKFVDDLFAPYRDAAKGGATVVVAQNGNVLIDAAYGIAPQRRLMPETAVPNFALGSLSDVLNAALPAGPATTRFNQAASRRVIAVGGMQRPVLDSTTGAWQASVDDLYRFEQGRWPWRGGAADTVSRGFAADTDHGVARWSAFAKAGGKRAAWIRYPASRTVILVLTNDDSADVKAMAQKIADKLLAAKS